MRESITISRLSARSESACMGVIIGQRFGEIEVLGPAPSPTNATGIHVFVRCDCGAEYRTRLRNLHRGIKKCGRRSHWDKSVLEAGQALVGQRFGRLIVTAATSERAVSPGGSRAAQVQVKCDCGVERYARVADLKKGVRSCGECTREITNKAKRWEVQGKRMTYAIEAVGTGLIKIGRARDIRERMWKLQHTCPVELRTIASTPDDIERRLHIELDQHRAFAEWFHLNDAVRAVIERDFKPDNISVLAELGRGVAGKTRGKQCRCKRCGQLGHYAKTCAISIDKDCKVA